MAHSHTPGIFRQLILAGLATLAGRGRRGVQGDVLAVRRILVVELWNIGDVVLLLPFLAQLRSVFPSASISLLARPHAREILDGTGLVDEYLDEAAPSDNWLSLNPLLGGWKDLWKLRADLRSREFDVAFQCRLHVREHVILAMSGAGRRVGYAFGEGDTMLTDAIAVDDLHRHKVEDWMGLLAPFGGPVAVGNPGLHVPATEATSAREFLEANSIAADSTVVGLHPGASVAEKRWPIERFAEIARKMTSRAGTRVMVFVDPAGYGEALGKIPGVVVARPSLKGLVALIDKCDLFVCNDSGPMHIAGGLGVPVVAVFSSGVARWFAPLGEGHRLVSAEAGGVDAVPVEDVLRAASELLEPGI